MRIKTDLDVELEIPKTIEQRYKKWCKENGLTEEYDNFAFSDFWFDIEEEYSGKLLPKEEAVFWANWITENTSTWGGYPFDYGMTFEDKNGKYTILVVGWTGGIKEEPKNFRPCQFAYIDFDIDR